MITQHVRDIKQICSMQMQVRGLSRSGSFANERARYALSMTLAFVFLGVDE